MQKQINKNKKTKPEDSSPSHFDANSMKKDTTDNWVLKKTNLRKVLSYLQEYYINVLDATPKPNFLSEIDLEAIGKEESASEILKLVQLVIGCIFSSYNKEEFVNNIMNLDQNQQTQLMLLMRSVMDRYNLYNKSSGAPSSRPPADSSAFDIDTGGGYFDDPDFEDTTEELKKVKVSSQEERKKHQAELERGKLIARTATTTATTTTNLFGFLIQFVCI